MAVYSKLLLSAGGGIVSTMQQAEQAKNTASLLIGLGGTGIDCLRTIKTQVRSRLRPDDPDAVVPKYEHIRFLGVDTAEKSKGDQDEDQDNLKAGALIALDDVECFSISNPHVKRTFSSPKGLEMREELSWLRWEDIDAPDLGKAGAGGIRQIGRFMMMDRSKAFMSRVEQEINAAKAGLIDPTVYVHIFSGLSGGTGAGCFLDVCYMVRHIANKVGGVTIFGYFFLPDVNLSVIPFSDTKTRAYVPKNGYASMQELDYCMQLQYNGGGFVQKYQDHTAVAWKEPPVDMCHLVCATDSSNNVIENAYDYAMNVTTEYVMDFLTHSNTKFDLAEQLANFRAKVRAADDSKVIGSHVAYCVIGAACACIPLREINTYLASELFEKFSRIGQNVPSKADVENLAVAALARNAQGVSDIYNALYRELSSGFDNSYAAYTDDWKFVRDYGNSDMVTHYTNQTAAKLNIAVKNSRSMVSEGNQQSLIARVREQLARIIRNIDCGPIFAYGLISAAKSHNLLNIIDGLLEENNSRWNQESAQDHLRVEDYERARADFENRRRRELLDNDQKRFNDYEYDLMLLEQHKLAMSCYQELDSVLKLFRKQLEDITASYYIKLSRVMDTLIQSFKENRDALASEKIMQTKSSFAIPMMTIAELKKALDAEIETINVPGRLDEFMALFLDHEDDWIAEDENKIAKLVNGFFVETAFHGFANRTITAFLKDKYRIDNDEQLSNKIYNDWMKVLTTKASPLFYFNNEVWQESDTSKLASLSFPDSSAPIKAAAERMHMVNDMWVTKESALTDRIFVMCSACALPLSAYNNCAEYEAIYFSSNAAGCHYYEGKDVPGMPFNDWRKLSSLTPQSLLHLERAPEPMQRLISAAQALYEEANRFALFDDDNRICVPDEGHVKALQALIDEANGKISQAAKASDIAGMQELLTKLKAARTLPMTATSNRMQNDGHAAKRETRLSVQKDHFVASPAYHILVGDILRQIKALDAAAESAITGLEKKVAKIGEGSRAISDFCDALFTGVISMEGRVLVYRPESFGVVTEKLLSKRGEEFPFNVIPIYQGFLSYQNLLTAEDRAAIRESVDARYNSNSPEIGLTGAKLKTELADNKLRAWLMSAESFPEKTDIQEFIVKLQQQFHIFCTENGI